RRRDGPAVLLPREGDGALRTLDVHARDLVAVHGHELLVTQRGHGARNRLHDLFGQEQHAALALAHGVHALLRRVGAADEQRAARAILVRARVDGEPQRTIEPVGGARGRRLRHELLHLRRGQLLEHVADRLGVLREATKAVSEFRDRTILTLDRKAVSGFDVAADGAALSVAHVGDAWRITKPVALPADTEAIGDMLEKLTSAKVKEFVTEAPPSRAAYGLDRPLRLTIHTGTDKDRASRTLLVGRTD